MNTKKTLFLIIVIVIILIIALTVLLKPKDTVNAPVQDLEDSEQVTDTATTTEDMTTGVDEAATEVETLDQVQGDEDVVAGQNDEQVIRGDGFIATVREVTDELTGPTPAVKEFSVKQNDGAACMFSWRVVDAETCDFLNVDTKRVVRDLSSKGNIQSGSGSYVLECEGSGGIEIVSETVVCN